MTLFILFYFAIYDNRYLNSGVRVELNGESNVRWTERKGSGKNKRTVHIRSNEIFADKQIYLIGGG